MSFMFNPFPYDDPSAVNEPVLPPDFADAIIRGTAASVSFIANRVLDLMQEGDQNPVIAFDGYTGARFGSLVDEISKVLDQKQVEVRAFPVEEIYKSSEEIEEMLSANLAEDREKDPVLLFGKLFRGGYEDFMDEEKIAGFMDSLESFKKNRTGQVCIVYGAGCTLKKLRQYYDLTCYLDVTPKEVILRARRGEFANVGDKTIKPIRAFLRRCYYVDFELAGHLRWELIREGEIDFYIASTDPDHLTLLTDDSLDSLMGALVKQPLRCKPVYLEGVWGGHYIRRLRKLPDAMRNCAWVFDLIPLEVSIVVKVKDVMIDFPFFTFVQKKGEELMGREALETFGGYFPIRFNYDDSFHSSGNMSIQLHSGHDYNVENYGEHGRQDESYYIVATGHGAKTYIGFRDNIDPEDFLEEARVSERQFTPIDYGKYIHHIKSEPGVQVLIPAGTIHSSGRNQVVLEIGSLTVGSYTYKMYDYLRADLDGKPRPIHTYHGEKTIARERKAGWVSENLVQKPRLIEQGEDWAEFVVGEHELLYFTLRRLEFETSMEGDTGGKFHVLTLVDGEQVRISSVEDPALSYTQNYLDVVVVPASVGKYKITNLGNQPVSIHKTMLKDGFSNDRVFSH